ncbi:MAG: hypothetical protein RR403_04235 [Pseudoflavonifractor sp.]
MELTLQFGDKVGLTNAFSAELDVEDQSADVNITLSSQGDSDGKDSVYARETTLSLSADKEELGSLTINTSYDAKAKDDNFSFDCTLTVEGEELAANARGTVLIDGDKGTLSCDFSRLSVEGVGETLAFSGTFSVAPLTAFSFTPTAPVMVLKNFPDSIDTDSMEANLTVLQEKLYEAFPDLKPFEADKYMEGYLQAVLLGKADAAFLQQSGLTQSDVAAMHERVLRRSVEVFSGDFSLDYEVSEDEALMQPAAEFYERLYQYMYDNNLLTVTGYREDSDGDYAVTVVPTLLYLWDTITNTNAEAYSALSARMNDLTAQESVLLMDYEELNAWAQKEYWPVYIDGLVALCDLALASPLSDHAVQNPMTIHVYDYESGQGNYTVDDTDLANFISMVDHIHP